MGFEYKCKKRPSGTRQTEGMKRGLVWKIERKPAKLSTTGHRVREISVEVYGVKFLPLRPEVLLTRTQFEIYILKGSSSASYINVIELEKYISLPLYTYLNATCCCCEYHKLVVDLHKKLIHSIVTEPLLFNPNLCFPAVCNYHICKYKK